jgi:hypothetical protein
MSETSESVTPGSQNGGSTQKEGGAIASSVSSSVSFVESTSEPDSKAIPQKTIKAATELTLQPLPNPERSILKSFSAEALAQALAEKLAISANDWHRLSANRAVRAREQAAAALVYMLKDQPQEALPRLAQAIGWLDKTLKAPPCPSHGPSNSAKPGSTLK